MKILDILSRYKCLDYLKYLVLNFVIMGIDIVNCIFSLCFIFIEA